MPAPRELLFETARLALEPEEDKRLGELIRAAEAAKVECAKYCEILGLKYSMYATSPDCSVGFENGFAVIHEPRRIFRAS
jgi:hypothetical protein